MWVNEMTFDLDQFTSNMFVSIIWNEDFQLCSGLGWETEQLLFRILFTMKFWNCSKTLVNDLADFSSTWTGYYAKYFEECNQSNNAEVILYEKTIKDAKEKIWKGTTDAKSVTYCKGLFGSAGSSSMSYQSDQTILLAKMAYKTFFDYVTAAYPDSFE